MMMILKLAAAVAAAGCPTGTIGISSGNFFVLNDAFVMAVLRDETDVIVVTCGVLVLKLGQIIAMEDFGSEFAFFVAVTICIDHYQSINQRQFDDDGDYIA
ncbi:hypothetical protein DERP_007442 [Dermatophagoides pteronyssinus]|uniref:Secreted protein n=1 Tax=Dermatophagoides pteronyssinus TaxID=6956 RepID=A0ABQ8J4J3_DERPT|nr:hypothetical protein DERP_007442 [Dermatophagoides pteronyssinus]